MIWFSCFCCPSENFRLTPAAAAESWIDFVLAVRQPALGADLREAQRQRLRARATSGSGGSRGAPTGGEAEGEQCGGGGRHGARGE